MSDDKFDLADALKKGTIFQTSPEEVENLRNNEITVETIQPFAERRDGSDCARGPCINHIRRIYIWYGNQCYLYYRTESC